MRKYTEADLEQVNKWLSYREWPPFSADMLPKTGYIVDDVAVGFLYRADSSMCMMEWIVTNPKQPRELRHESLDKVIQALIQEAKDSGYKTMFSSLEAPDLIERYGKNGFIITEKHMTNMIRIL